MTRAMNDRTVKLSGGVLMPLLGFGTWQITGKQAYLAVRTAVDAGYRLFDTATMYGNEAQIGRALAECGVPQEEFFITTKLPPRRMGRALETLTESLSALRVDHLDLWLIHWPSGGASPKTWEQMIAARENGLTRAIGVSNYTAALIDELTAATGVTPQVNQIEWGPSLYNPAVVVQHRERGVVLEGYSPFKTTNLRHPTLQEIADKHGVSTAQVVVRWHIEHGFVVIPKSARPERIRSNADVYGFSLTEDEVARIDAMAGGHR